MVKTIAESTAACNPARTDKTRDRIDPSPFASFKPSSSLDFVGKSAPKITYSWIINTVLVTLSTIQVHTNTLHNMFDLTLLIVS